MNVPDAPTPPMEAQPKRIRVKLAAFADSATDASLDPNHPSYAEQPVRDAGSVPMVIATDEMSRFAVLSSGCVGAQLRVPFGWHVVEKDHHVVVFHARNEIYIRLARLPRESGAEFGKENEIEAQMRGLVPRGEHLHYHALGPLGQSKVQSCQAQILTPAARKEDAVRLAELIARSLDFGSFPEPESAGPDAGGKESKKAKRKAMVNSLQVNGSVDLVRNEAILAHPAEPGGEATANWWHEALALEAADQLAAAEKLITKNVPHLGCAASTAEMYRLRMNRLKQAGDEAGAIQAFKKAAWWIWNYASMATSGGEGAALSLERDRFRTQLVSDFGYDPESPK